MAVTVGLEEIKDRWNGQVPFEDAFLSTQIQDAVTELREHIPDLDSLVESGQISQESVNKIVAKAVIGVLRNPEGFKTETDQGYSYGRYGDGFVWFRQSDIDRLRPATPSASWSWVL